MPEDDEFKVKRELHPNIPDVYKAAAILLISPLRGGKTSAIVNFILTPRVSIKRVSPL